KYIRVPVKKAPQKTLLSDIQISDTDWKAPFFSQLKECYLQAPFFKPVSTELNDWLRAEQRQLCNLNISLLRYLLAKLGIEQKIIDSASLAYDHTATAEEKLIRIAQSLGADMYVNAAGGTELYSKEIWRENGLDLRFIKSGES